jgi:hypothetical protein
MVSLAEISLSDLPPKKSTPERLNPVFKEIWTVPRKAISGFALTN